MTMVPETGPQIDEPNGRSTSQPVDIRILDSTSSIADAATLFQQVWGTSQPIVAPELMRSVGHSGGYVVGAYEHHQMIGASFGFLGRHNGTESLNSQITGILPGLQRSGVGRAIKAHQRQWAAERGIAWITWTFDPLVRRNAHFNLTVLGCKAAEYLRNFYGAMGDAINGVDESDRLLAAWPTNPQLGVGVDAPAGEVIKVATPVDIVALRRVDPMAATKWRQRLRAELGEPMDAGSVIVGFDLDGNYLLQDDPVAR